MPTAQTILIVSFNFTYVIVKYCQGNNTKKFLLGIFFTLF